MKENFSKFYNLGIRYHGDYCLVHCEKSSKLLLQINRNFTFSQKKTLEILV